MSKSTAASVESSLPSALNSFKESAAQVKDAHRTARKAIQDDDMISEKARKERLEALDKDTRAKLDGIRAKQESYVKELRAKVEKEFRGNQPTDASSVLLRRDAADRARKLDRKEALEVLQDAIANGDAEMAHAVGTKARNLAWLDVAEAYTAAHPDTADSAAALAYVEATTSGAAYNLSNQMTYAAPLTD